MKKLVLSLIFIVSLIFPAFANDEEIVEFLDFFQTMELIEDDNFEEIVEENTDEVMKETTDQGKENV
jgi:thioredoxin-related protein